MTTMRHRPVRWTDVDLGKIGHGGGIDEGVSHVGLLGAPELEKVRLAAAPVSVVRLRFCAIGRPAIGKCVGGNQSTRRLAVAYAKHFRANRNLTRRIPKVASPFHRGQDPFVEVGSSSNSPKLAPCLKRVGSPPNPADSV